MGRLEWRGLDVDDPDGIFFEVAKGFRMPPTVRGVDYTIAGAAGRDAGDREADVYPVLLEGYVAGDDAEDWAANRDALLATLDEVGPPAPGTLTVRAPLFGLAEGESVSIQCHVRNVIEGPIESYQRQTFSIALESIDPTGWVLSIDGS